MILSEIVTQLEKAGSQAHVWFGQQIGEALQQRDMAKLSDLIQAGTLIKRKGQNQDENLHLEHWWCYANAIYIKNVQGDQTEAIALLEKLRTEECLPQDLHGRILNAAGMVYAQNERWDRATQAYLEASLFYESQNDALGQAKVLQHLAELHYKAQDYAKAVDYAQQSIA